MVLPAYNAAQTLQRTIDEIPRDVVDDVILTDDASRDETRSILVALKGEIPALRVIAHGANAGQSRAVRTGVMAATGEIIVTLDGDGQNDPADAPRLVQLLSEGPATLALVGGERVKRQDTAAKRIASRLANGIRKRLLNDQANDTGCGLKVFRREAFLRLPYFDHIHRYLPALMIREGYQVAFAPVGHRPRTTGASKYTNLQRLWAALSDLTGVMWLNRRARLPEPVKEL